MAIPVTVYPQEQKVLGIKKETSRGVAETAFTTFYPVPKETEFDYKLNHIEDENTRGISGKLAPQSGTLEGAGKIPGFDVTSMNIGEALYSLFGKVTSAQQGGTTAYKHTYVKRTFADTSPNYNTHQSYTVNIRRGVNNKLYSLAVLKSMTLNGTPDGILKADMDWLFQQEAADSATPTVTWTAPTPFTFNQGAVSLDATQNYYIPNWSITFDNGARFFRPLSGQAYPYDINCEPMMSVTGTLQMIFADDTARTKFLANTAVALSIAYTGAQISGAYYNTLTLTVPEIRYKEVAYGAVDGYIGSAISFEAYYNIATTKNIQADLTNITTSY